MARLHYSLEFLTFELAKDTTHFHSGEQAMENVGILERLCSDEGVSERANPNLIHLNGVGTSVENVFDRNSTDSGPKFNC